MVTREELSTILDRFELWMDRVIDYQTDDYPYRTTLSRDMAREDLFKTLIEVLKLS